MRSFALALVVAVLSGQWTGACEPLRSRQVNRGVVQYGAPPQSFAQGQCCGCGQCPGRIQTYAPAVAETEYYYRDPYTGRFYRLAVEERTYPSVPAAPFDESPYMPPVNYSFPDRYRARVPAIDPRCPTGNCPLR